MWAIATNACMYRKALLDRRNTLRVEAVLLKSLNLYSTHACFNSRKICSNGDREGKENLLVTKVIGKGEKKKSSNTETPGSLRWKEKKSFFFFFPLCLTFYRCLNFLGCNGHASNGIHNLRDKLCITVKISKQVLHESVEETSVKSLPSWFIYFSLKHVRITRSDSKQFQNALRCLFALVKSKLTRIAKSPLLLLKLALYQRNNDYILRKKTWMKILMLEEKTVFALCVWFLTHIY